MSNTIHKIWFILCLFTLGGLAWALPEGASTIYVDVNFETNQKEMIINAPGDNQFADFESFNIAVDETVRIQQTSEQSRFLARVTGSSVSQINGRLIANGQFYLVNPSGIIFGSGAVVEAAKLNAIAGVLSNEDFVNGTDHFSALLGPVENAGSIEAEQIVLAGSSVSNTGNLNSLAGEVVLGAGGSMTMSSADGFLSVSVSTESTAPVGAATDLIGQTLLNSGIIQGKETHLLGNQITHTGTIESDAVILSDYTEATASSGTFLTSNLSVLGSASSDTTPPSTTLNSSTNQISNLRLSGRLEQLKVRSSMNTVVDVEGEDLFRGSPTLQHGDIRVSGGDLDLKVSFSPVFSGQSATLLLASSEDLNLEPTLQTLGKSYQFVMYGKNLQASDITALEDQLPDLQINYQNAVNLEDPNGFPVYPFEYTQNILNEITAIENTLSDLYALDGNSLSLDDLAIGLDSTSIQKLASENPSSSAFAMENAQAFGINQSAQENSVLNENPTLTTPTAEQPGMTPQGSSGGPPTGMPDTDPNHDDLLANQATGILTPEQIQLAVDNGLFANYSYYLDSSSDLNPVVEAIGESGGVSSIFGGSYAVVESVSSGPTVSSVEAEGGSSAAESESTNEATEESTESAEDSSDTDDGDSGSTTGPSGGQSARSVSTSQVLGAAPFAPISSPVLSPAASLILEEALSPRVEMKLSNYIDR